MLSTASNMHTLGQFVVTALFLPRVWAYSPSPPGYPGWSGASRRWSLKKFTTLVAFGDSYTDDNRLNYFASNGGQAPPVGWVNPVNYNAADGGRPWPNYVQQYSGVRLYNYAVSGAVCSNDITPRYFAYINADFPAVAQYEVPAYLADSEYVQPDGTRFFIGPASETVYSIWIGTNDLGVGAFLTDNQVASTNVRNYTQCVFDSLRRVYASGGRYFVLMTVPPLNLAPLYALPGHGDSGDNRYWPDKATTANATDVSYRMENQVAAVNAIFEYQTPFLVSLTKRFPGAQFAVMDTHGLMTDIYHNPSQYLNGSAPLNVTGYIDQCNIAGSVCEAFPNPDSFMWYDALHPSEQTERIIAKTFVDVVRGTSRWATYWSS